VVVAADPVLHGADPTCHACVGSTSHQQAVDGDQVSGLDRRHRAGLVHGELHRVDVGEDLRHLLAWIPPSIGPGLGSSERPSVDLEAFDLRPSNALSVSSLTLLEHGEASAASRAA
jgi:hypothetical protein